MEFNVTADKFNDRTIIATFDDVTLFRFNAMLTDEDLQANLPRLRLLTLPVGFTRLQYPDDKFSVRPSLQYAYPTLYGVAIGDNVCAVLPYQLGIRSLTAVWITEPAYLHNVAEAKIHEAFSILARRLKATIPLRQTPYCAPFLRTPNGTLLEPTLDNLNKAFYGIVSLPADISAEGIKAASKAYMTLDVTDLPQLSLDTLCLTAGSLRSSARVVLLRNLETVEHLLLPEAEIILAPKLSIVFGRIVAPKATYVDFRSLSACYGDIELNSLTHTTFEFLGVVDGDITLPAAKGIGFPMLTRFDGKLQSPSDDTVNMPVLSNADCFPIGFVTDAETPVYSMPENANAAVTRATPADAA